MAVNAFQNSCKPHHSLHPAHIITSWRPSAIPITPQPYQAFNFLPPLNSSITTYAPAHPYTLPAPAAAAAATPPRKNRLPSTIKPGTVIFVPAAAHFPPTSRLHLQTRHNTGFFSHPALVYENPGDGTLNIMPFTSFSSAGIGSKAGWAAAELCFYLATDGGDDYDDDDDDSRDGERPVMLKPVLGRMRKPSWLNTQVAYSVELALLERLRGAAVVFGADALRCIREHRAPRSRHSSSSSRSSSSSSSSSSGETGPTDAEKRRQFRDAVMKAAAAA